MRLIAHADNLPAQNKIELIAPLLVDRDHLIARFAGRFLGHGTPFQDQDGKWWCTAFFNANVPPLPRQGIEKRNLSENAQTINEQGVTIVPLDVKVLDDGDIYIRAKDPAYATPGPEEAQRFINSK